MIQLKELSSVRLNKKLAGYTLLGAAAFTLTGKAHANDITLVSVDRSFNSNATNTYNLNLSGGASPDFTINAENIEGFIFSVDASVNNGAQLITDTNGAAALAFDLAINPLGSGWGNGGKMTGTGEGFGTGDWPSNGGSAYLGFYYVGTDGDHAGWINVSTASNGSDAYFIVNNYAYDTTAGEAITAGQTVGSNSTAVTPEPSTLSLLAMGSAGLVEVRRRRRNHA